MQISAVSTASQKAMIAAIQEAMESATQTKTEAAKGDPQAVAKLARMNAQQAASAVSSAVPPDGTGNVMNVQR